MLHSVISLPLKPALQQVYQGEKSVSSRVYIIQCQSAVALVGSEIENKKKKQKGIKFFAFCDKYVHT